jgi:hypothetical protein
MNRFMVRRLDFGCATMPFDETIRVSTGGTMIDTITETIISFHQASDEGPRRGRGRKIHISTYYRWATVGCRGVVLETVQIGGSRCTYV